MQSEHWKKYEALCMKHNVCWNVESPSRVGENLESIAAKYKEDEYLNNVPLSKWDNISVYPIPGTTLSERVCMHKHACIEMLRRESLI